MKFQSGQFGCLPSRWGSPLEPLLKIPQPLGRPLEPGQGQSLRPQGSWVILPFWLVSPFSWRSCPLQDSSRSSLDWQGRQGHDLGLVVDLDYLRVCGVCCGLRCHSIFLALSTLLLCQSGTDEGRDNCKKKKKNSISKRC